MGLNPEDLLGMLAGMPGGLGGKIPQDPCEKLEQLGKKFVMEAMKSARFDAEDEIGVTDKDTFFSTGKYRMLFIEEVTQDVLRGVAKLDDLCEGYRKEFLDSSEDINPRLLDKIAPKTWVLPSDVHCTVYQMRQAIKAAREFVRNDEIVSAGFNEDLNYVCRLSLAKDVDVAEVLNQLETHMREEAPDGNYTLLAVDERGACLESEYD